MNLTYGMTLIMGYPEIYSSLVNVVSISHFSHICGKSIHIYLPYHYLKEIPVMFLIYKYTYTMDLKRIHRYVHSVLKGLVKIE